MSYQQSRNGSHGKQRFNFLHISTQDGSIKANLSESISHGSYCITSPEPPLISRHTCTEKLQYTAAGTRGGPEGERVTPYRRSPRFNYLQFKLSPIQPQLIDTQSSTHLPIRHSYFTRHPFKDKCDF